jgi:hypothetical protein
LFKKFFDVIPFASASATALLNTGHQPSGSLYGIPSSIISAPFSAMPSLLQLLNSIEDSLRCSKREDFMPPAPKRGALKQSANSTHHYFFETFPLKIEY